MLLLMLLYKCSVVLFIGNMIGGLFWKMIADKTNDDQIKAHTFSGIIKSDLLITIPSLAIILSLNYFVNTGKTLPASSLPLPHIIMFVSVYCILMFLFVIHPIRSSLLKMVARAKVEQGDTMIRYKKLSLAWVVFGIMELGPLILVLLLSL